MISSPLRQFHSTDFKLQQIFITVYSTCKYDNFIRLKTYSVFSFILSQNKSVRLICTLFIFLYTNSTNIVARLSNDETDKKHFYERKKCFKFFSAYIIYVTISEQVIFGASSISTRFSCLYKSLTTFCAQPYLKYLKKYFFRVQITAIWESWIQSRERSLDLSWISPGDHGVWVRSKFSGSWIMVWYPLWKSPQSWCLWKHSRLCSWIWISKTVSGLKKKTKKNQFTILNRLFN